MCGKMGFVTTRSRKTVKSFSITVVRFVAALSHKAWRDGTIGRPRTSGFSESRLWLTT